MEEKDKKTPQKAPEKESSSSSGDKAKKKAPVNATKAPAKGEPPVKSDEKTSEKPAEEKKKKKKSKVPALLLLLGFVAAACILVYPTFMDSMLDIKQSFMLGGYIDAMGDLTDEEVDQMRLAAIEYNNSIYEQQQKEIFRYRGDQYTDEVYESILKISDMNAVMGYIEIPSINLYLPITHGTKSEELNYMAGHMYGTSVPIGGVNTHSVVAAHTGLATADLFTNVYKLEGDDEVKIHVLDEVRVYTVLEVFILEPMEVTPYLQIEEGEDLVTLFTCTPYGINDHRRLIRCKYSYSLDREALLGSQADINSVNKLAILHTILWGLIPVGILAFGLYRIFHKKKKKKDKDEEKKDKKKEKPEKNTKEEKAPESKKKEKE